MTNNSQFVSPGRLVGQLAVGSSKSGFNRHQFLLLFSWALSTALSFLACSLPVHGLTEWLDRWSPPLAGSWSLYRAPSLIGSAFIIGQSLETPSSCGGRHVEIRDRVRMNSRILGKPTRFAFQSDDREWGTTIVQ